MSFVGFADASGTWLRLGLAGPIGWRLSLALPDASQEELTPLHVSGEI